MRSVRILAILSFALVAAFYVLRALAAQCAGPECETFIPFSLLLPLAALVLAAVTGYLAIDTARARPQGVWLALSIISTILSVTRPIASAVDLRATSSLLS